MTKRGFWQLYTEASRGENSRMCQRAGLLKSLFTASRVPTRRVAGCISATAETRRRVNSPALTLQEPSTAIRLQYGPLSNRTVGPKSSVLGIEIIAHLF